MENIVNSIKAYFKSENPDGAFQIKGDWGCGKTFFVKEILPHKLVDTNRIQVMISLFGIGDVKEIPYKLLNAYINKMKEIDKNAEEDMNRGLDYLDLKYGIDRKFLGINLHDEDELIYNIIPKDKVYLCLDDVERFIKKDNVEEVMGYVNNLVENLGYKVIVILNENYHTNDNEVENVKSIFKEKIIGKSMTFAPDIREIFNGIVETYKDDAFNTFMKRNDIVGLFMPKNRDKHIQRDFENIRTLKFAISNFKNVFEHFKDALEKDKTNHTFRSLKYYLAFIIAVSIEYKKGKLTEEDCHDIDIDTEIFSLNFINDNDISEQEVQDLFNEVENTKEEKERLKKQQEYNDIYRRRFYKVYANDVNLPNIYHGELYNSITKGFPIDFEKLTDNLNKKVFDNEKNENYGNIIVTQTLDGTIFDYSDEEIKSKMFSLLECVKDGSLQMCAAYINAYSFLDTYRSVIAISDEELLDKFKVGFSKYVHCHNIDRTESTGLQIVSQDIPQRTKVFYDFLHEELRNKWDAQYKQSVEEMKSLFCTDFPSFCNLFIENRDHASFRYNTDAVLQYIPEDIVENRMQNLSPKDVHELAKFINQRFKPQDIYSFHLDKEKDFLLAMKRGIEAIDGDDTVSKVEARTVLLNIVNNALEYIEIGKRA